MTAEVRPDRHHVLAIDPGATTGLCRGILDVQSERLELLVGEARLSLLDMHELLSLSPEHVIYETFEYRNYSRPGLDLTPVKLIGVIELNAELQEDIHFYKQSAASGKAFYRDDRLKQLGAYAVGKQHGRDATRHLLQWLTFGAGSQYADIEKLEIELTVEKL